MIYIISHTCPDTDSIIASIVYQKFLEKRSIESTAIALWETNNETKFILNRLWIDSPPITTSLQPESKIALVDHNEAIQSIPERDQYEIVAVIDHHKVWWFSSPWVPFVRIERVWSTNTIIAKLFKEHWVEIDKPIAKLIISAIISDTMFFRAPTTTTEDRQTIENLNKIAWYENLEEYSLEMFKAKSNLWDISPKQVIKTDYKEYQFWDKKIGLWVLETTNPDYALWRKIEIVEAMIEMKQQGLDFVSLSIVDIINQTNLTIVPWDDESLVYEKLLWWKKEEHLCDLWNKVSRKLDIVPVLTKYFS